MSRHVRQRATAVLLGGLLLGAPLLTTGIANAGQSSTAPGERSQVTATPSVSPSVGTAPRTSIKRANKIKTKIRRGTGSSASISVGKPPTNRKTGVRRVPTLDLSSPTHLAPAAPARPGPDTAAEQVAAAQPMSGSGLIGLLAAVSMVLVLGVSAGVIRAIVSERASRTKIA